jgi:hypothetical protein
MFSKIFITILALTISVASFGADEKAKPTEKKEAEAPPTFLKYVKDAFAFSYHGEYYYSHNEEDNKLRDFDQLHSPTLSYKFAKDWKFVSSAEFKYSDHNRNGFPNRFFRGLFSLNRDNILNEKDHGVKLELGVARRVFDEKTVASSHGNTRLTSNFSKALSWGNGKHTASLFAQYMYNDPKVFDAKTWKHDIELIPVLNLQLIDVLSLSLLDDIVMSSAYEKTPRSVSISHEAYATLTYKVNDKISSYLQFKHTHGEDFSNPGSNTFECFIGGSYAFTPKIALSPELGTTMFESNDPNFFSNKFKYVNLALYLDISL